LCDLDLPILGMMADLGFSSDQLEDADRGLSFQWDGPLDMRLDPTRGESARSFLQKVTIKELETILSELGEERYSKTVAAAIIQSRRDRQLPDTTRGLAELITRSVPPPARHLRIHPATRTFQALRIHVNEELKELDRLLEHVIVLLQTGGRVAILSFHSLEDRKVKIAFKGDAFEALTKKPVEADEEEISRNPRSRSAKLRIAQKV
jgi:16S rRNA (cytosine1402-N4)-methyltransferase